MNRPIGGSVEYEWLKAYIAMSRAGHVTEAIQACEATWGAKVLGDATAVEAIRRVPGYPAFARALRRSLRFPLLLYRARPRHIYETWRANPCGAPIGATISLRQGVLLQEAYADASTDMVLLEILVRDPRAIIMRGRIEFCEIVIDLSWVSPADVSVYQSDGNHRLTAARTQGT